MAKIDLKKRLDEIKLKGSAAFSQYKSSRDVLYRTFAESYLLWRECQAEKGLLESEYKKAGIKYKTFSENRVNFSPFIKLVFGIKGDTGAEKNKVGHWSSVLRALDDDFCSRPAYYATKPSAKLVDLIRASGGITEIHKRDLTPDMEDSSDSSRKAPSKKDLAAIAAAVASRRIEQLITEPPLPIAVAEKFVRRVPVDKNGLVAFIGKLNAEGKIELVATTVDTAALQSVAVSSMRDYSEDIDPSLRTLVEVVHTQTFPQIGKPSDKNREREWRRVVETHETNIKKLITVTDPKTGKQSKERRKLSNPRRVLILGDRNQIIYGRMREEAAAVTVMKPKLQLAGKQIVMMNAKERRALEEPIIDGSMAIYRATPTDKLQPVTGQPGCDFHLKLENTATQKTATVRFEIYKDILGRSATNFQSIFDAKGDYSPTWEFNVKQSWFQQLREDWLNRWFETLGFNTRILRSDSKVFEWKVDSRQLMIRFEIDDDKYADKHIVDLPPVKMTGNKVQSCLLASMDLAPVLYNLSEIAIRDKITVSGNANAVLFAYETDMGEFKVALPTQQRVDGKFEASTEHFSKVE
jgi:hypothetical protein